MSTNFILSSDAINSLILARKITSAYKLPYITPCILLVSINTLDDSPLHRYFINKGFDSNKIAEAGISLANKYVALNNINSDSIATFQLPEPYGIFYIDPSIFDILGHALSIGKQFYESNDISCRELIVTFAEYFPTLFDDLLQYYFPRENNISNALIPLPIHTNSDFGNISTNYDSLLPPSLATFLTVMNKKYSPDEKQCTILGREEETQKLLRVLAKTTKRNAVLVGKPGVGKTALVEMLTWMIVTGNCPERFKNNIVISLDVNSIVAGTKYRGSAEERFQLLISFIAEHKNCILFIDEIHLLLGAGACKDGDLDLANALKPLLARGEAQVIGATTYKEYEEYFSKDGALKRRFEKIEVKEPRSTEVYPMIKNQISNLEKSHNTTITKELVDFIILNASCFNYETQNPDRTLDLIDKSMVCAELDGRTEVLEEDVLANFSVNKRKFEKMSLEFKTATAYHEAGHCLIRKFSNELVNYTLLAVSILPAEGYLGINVYDSDNDYTPSCNREYYVQLIAMLLGGRIAEKLFTNTLSAGASSDLAKATGIAKDVITRYGLDEDFTQDRVYLRESKNPMYTEDVITQINGRIDVLLKEARTYAENIFNNHKKELDELVDTLLTNNIVSSEGLESIFGKDENS